MAKYDGKTDFPVITNSIIQIVDDAVGFLSSKFCDNHFRNHNVNPFYWKWVKIASHRRGGFTTAALQLLQNYKSSLIVTHNYPSANRMREFAVENNLVPLDTRGDVFYNNIAIKDYIIPHSRMNDNWFCSLGRRYQLIILDPASIIEIERQRQQGQSFAEFRDRLFNICDLLVELS